MFGFKKGTKAALKAELSAAQESIAILERELSRVRLQHQSLVAQVTYYQGALADMGNQVQTWMRMHGDVLKQLGEQTPNLKAYADSVAQAIRESYPDPAALIAVIAMGNAAAGTQGALTRSPTKGDPRVGIALRQEEPEQTARISR